MCKHKENLVRLTALSNEILQSSPSPSQGSSSFSPLSPLKRLMEVSVAKSEMLKNNDAHAQQLCMP
jgi:hypothetical protein